MHAHTHTQVNKNIQINVEKTLSGTLKDDRKQMMLYISVKRTTDKGMVAMYIYTLHLLRFNRYRRALIHLNLFLSLTLPAQLRLELLVELGTEDDWYERGLT